VIDTLALLPLVELNVVHEPLPILYSHLLQLVPDEADSVTAVADVSVTEQETVEAVLSTEMADDVPVI
jgi:hypothetical protein